MIKFVQSSFLVVLSAVAISTGLGFQRVTDSTAQWTHEAQSRGSSITIRKLSDQGELLPGSRFRISPSPSNCEGSLELSDNDFSDLDITAGVIQISQRCAALYYTIEEVEAPPGYILDATPHKIFVSDASSSVTVAFINHPESDPAPVDETKCAASCQITLTFQMRKGGDSDRQIAVNLPETVNEVEITNHDPGAKVLEIEINGTRFRETGLKAGESRTLDVASAITPGANVASIVARGPMKGGLSVTIGWD